MDEQKVKDLTVSIGQGLGAMHVLMNYGMEWDVAAIREALRQTIEVTKKLKKEVGLTPII